MLITEAMQELKDEFNTKEMRLKNGKPVFKFKISIYNEQEQNWKELENNYCGTNGMSAMDRAIEINQLGKVLCKADCIGYCDFYLTDHGKELFVEKEDEESHQCRNIDDFMTKIISSRKNMILRGEL